MVNRCSLGPVAQVLACFAVTSSVACAVPLAENHAPGARITANSQFDAGYRPDFVADGQIPVVDSGQDRERAWAVNGATHRDGAELTFEWDGRAPVKEIVYYGRTSWGVHECWKDYAVYLDEESAPACRGQFLEKDGPQRIVLSKRRMARQVRMVFTSSYGGLNPGAHEIEIYGESPSAEQLAWATSVLRLMPWVDQVERDALRALILRLQAKHGAAYPQAQAHLARLATAEDDGLADLQREVLLFDVDRLVAIRRHEIIASHVYTYHYEGFQAGGGLYVIDPRDPDAEPLELVATPAGQILDADLSYDGRRVLFSWRQTADAGYHLWTVDVDGTGLAQVTDGPWHDYNGCWLPDGGIAFLSTREAQFAYCWHAPVGIVHRMDANGANVRKLSANYLNDFTPYVLEDGRIIYSRWEYVDRPAIPIQSLWTINPDGTGLSGYFGNRVLSPGTFMEARQIPGTTKIVCTMTGHNGPTRGAIGIVDRVHGVNAQAAIENITPDVPLPSIDKGNGNTEGSKQYSCPLPLDDARFLVSAQGPLLARTYAGECQSLVLPPPTNGMQWFNAQPVRPRKRPPAVPARPAEDEDATLYVQDIYQGLEPQVPRGGVARIRVVREMQKTVRIDPSLRAFGFQFPVISCGATYAGKDVLGEVPVEADGSAYFRVPPNVPLYFMALDAHGRAVQRMRSFTHLMPGESQGCIGCHERRRTVPVSARGKAFDHPPRELEPPEWGRGGFSYARIVQPVLDEHCVECHGKTAPPKGLDLSGDLTDYFNVSYENLARDPQGPKGSPYVRWIPTYNGHEQNILRIEPGTWGAPASKLGDIVLSGHPGPDGTKRVALDAAERRRIFAWMDLNVPYYDTSETAHPERTGCRRIYPEGLDALLSDVAQRRCATCHKDGAFPRKDWTRITHPQYNNFLMAPLAKAAGGLQRCGEAVFASTQDPDYSAILDSFAPLAELLRQTPRMDMANAAPAETVCRDRK